MYTVFKADSNWQYCSFWLCFTTRVEVICPRKECNQINNSISKDKLSSRFYANTDEICVYLGQHHPHSVLGSVVGQNLSSFPGIARVAPQLYCKCHRSFHIRHKVYVCFLSSFQTFYSRLFPCHLSVSLPSLQWPQSQGSVLHITQEVVQEEKSY